MSWFSSLINKRIISFSFYIKYLRFGRKEVSLREKGEQTLYFWFVLRTLPADDPHLPSSVPRSFPGPVGREPGVGR